MTHLQTLFEYRQLSHQCPFLLLAPVHNPTLPLVILSPQFLRSCAILSSVTPTLLKSRCQLFCRISLHLQLSDVFLGLPCWLSDGWSETMCAFWTRIPQKWCCAFLRALHREYMIICLFTGAVNLDLVKMMPFWFLYCKTPVLPFVIKSVVGEIF